MPFSSYASRVRKVGYKIMTTTLTDFSKEELQWMLNRCRVEMMLNANILGRIDKNSEGMNKFFNRRFDREHAHGQHKIASQWVTKLTEAIQEIDAEEKIQSN